MTRVIFCLAAMVLLLAAMGIFVWAAAGAVRDGRDFTAEMGDRVEAGPAPDVEVEATNGFIEVTPWDRPEIEYTIEKRVRGRSVNERNADALLEAIRIEAEPRENGLSIEVKEPKNAWGTQYRADIHLRVPQDARLVLETTNGSVSVRGIAGHVTARTTNGKIAVHEASGVVETRTTNGSVQCEGFPLKFSGETTNGSVELVQTAVPEAWEGIDCNTVNGAVQVTLPKSAAFRIDARTVNGGIRTDFPLRVDGQILGKRLTGEVGGGGPELRLQTVNGSVGILAADS